MAWNVVIAGGGFGGAFAARELERVLPRQSARLMLVNDVNFLLYTPFLPEAAAGTLEPRHVVTPLRDILKRTYLRLGAVTPTTPPRAPSRSPITRARSASSATTSSSSRWARSRGCCRSPASSTRSASRASPTRSGCAITSSRPSRPRTTSEDPARRRGAAHVRLRRRRLRRPRGARRAPGLRRRRDRALSTSPAAGHELDPDRGDRPRPSRDGRRPRRYACESCAAEGIDIRLGTRLEEVAEDHVRLSTGETIPAGRSSGPRASRPPEPARAQRPARRARARSRRRAAARRGDGVGLGGRRLRRRARPGRRAVAGHRPARDPPGTHGGAETSPPRSESARCARSPTATAARS